MFAEAGLDTDRKRIFLVTDAQPNVGATGPGSFRELAGGLAGRGSVSP
jgi:hypothetical protein